MELSIVIVNYNVKYFLEHCLHSVFKSLKNIEAEVFVVDNNSVDGSIGMIREKFPEVELISNKENVGFARANNQAIKKALGKYVLLLNPDTVVEEDTFEKCLLFMDQHPDAGGLGVKMIDGKGNFLPESKRSLPTPSVAFYKIFGLSSLFPKSRHFGKYHLTYLSKDKIHEVDILPGAFLLIRKTVLDKTGLLDEQFFMYGEDIDLSYRILKAGYKNYYFPETTIIHYKGESTRKTSINYVRVFYTAMIIFAQKHFSTKNARLYSILINFAIYFRAFLSIVRRFILDAILPLSDAVTIFAGYLLIRPVWEEFKFQGSGKYPDEFLYAIVPTYIFIWLVSIFINGGYEKPVKAWSLVKGISIGTLLILLVYALLPENLRFSRALIIIGAFLALLSTFCVRFLLSIVSKTNFGFVIGKTKKRILIIGHKKESERVFSILKQTQIIPNLIGTVYPGIKSVSPGYLGDITQIEEIVRINRVNELIFCANDLSSQEIIRTMLKFSKSSLDFKIAPPESYSIIGSNSINSAGDLYIVDFNSIEKSTNRRQKRMLDIIMAFFLLLLSPVLVFVVKKPGRFLINIFLVVMGIFSWVGYNSGGDIENTNLPLIKKGILSPADILREEMQNQETINRAIMIYAKDYKLMNDLSIIFRSVKYLGRKISLND